MITLLLNIVVFLLLIYGFKSLHSGRTESLFFFVGLALKVGLGLLFGYLYLNHFGGGDTKAYFEASKEWNKLFFNAPSEYFQQIFFGNESLSGFFPRAPRAVFFVKIVSTFSIITNENYWLVTIYFSLISFFSTWFFYKQLIDRGGFHHMILWLVMFTFPGTLFWGSGILKETWSMSSLFVLGGIYVYFSTNKRLNWKHVVLMVFSVFILIRLKYYVAAVFLPIYGISWYLTLIKHLSIPFFKKKWVQYIIPLLLMTVIGLWVVQLSPNFYPGNLLSRIVEDQGRILQNTSPTYRINYDELRPEVPSFIKNSPLALVSGLFRPTVWEGTTSWQLLTGTQNLFFMFWMMFAGFLAIKNQNSPPLCVILLLIYCLVLATFLAFGIPNFGTLERLKVHYQPFLLILGAVPIGKWFRQLL